MRPKLMIALQITILKLKIMLSIEICSINGGGVAIYLHESIQYNLRQDLDDFDLTVVVELRLPHVKPIVIVTLYHPERSVEVFNRIETMVSKISEEKMGFILMGDLNCNLLMKGNSKTKHIVQIYDTYRMTQKQLQIRKP